MLYTNCLFRPNPEEGTITLHPGDEFDREMDLQRYAWSKVNRIYLEADDIFAADTDALVKLGESIKDKFPECKAISAYARIPELQKKSLDDLILLHELYFDEINVGVESGLDLVLMIFQKGYTVADAKEQLQKLEEAGMRYSLDLVLGGLGNGDYEEASKANADFLNEFQPYKFYTASVYADEGSQYYDLIHNDDFEFTENTFGKLMSEEIDFLSRLDLKNTDFDGTHLSNPIPLAGHLPDDKDDLIYALEEMRKLFPLDFLHALPTRGTDGCILVPEELGKKIAAAFGEDVEE